MASEVNFATQGTCDPRFDAVRQAFENNFEKGLDVGASVAVTLDGEFVVDLWGGAKDAARTTRWQKDTIAWLASTTKTALALSALVLADRGDLNVDVPVTHYWPEFSAKDVLVRHCLGHTAGMPGWNEQIRFEDLADWEKLTSLLARQTPWWQPGTDSGYHGLTQGYLVGEVVRRIAGMSVGQFFAREIAAPLGIDFHIGLEARDDARVAESIPPAVPEEPVAGPDSMAMRIHTNPPLPRERMREEWFRRVEIPAGNGIGNARSVARFSALIACEGELGGRRLMSREGARRVLFQQSDGPDLVFIAPVKFGLGYALALQGMSFDGHEVCFWGGSGGSLTVVDFARRMTLAYVMNKLEGSPFGDPRNTAILRATYRSLREIRSS